MQQMRGTTCSYINEARILRDDLHATTREALRRLVRYVVQLIFQMFCGTWNTTYYSLFFVLAGSLLSAEA